MNASKPLYLVTYTATRRGVPAGTRSVHASGDTASDALTKFHRAMQLRRAFAPHEYRVTRLTELDRVRRTVAARLPFPPGPNPRICASTNERSATHTAAAAQACFAF